MSTAEAKIAVDAASPLTHTHTHRTTNPEAKQP